MRFLPAYLALFCTLVSAIPSWHPEPRDAQPEAIADAHFEEFELEAIRFSDILYREDQADEEHYAAHEVDVDDYEEDDYHIFTELAKRRGGGGGKSGGKTGGTSGSGSSGGGSSSSGGSGRGSSGTTSSKPSFGGGRTYAGGSSTPYSSGQRSPGGISPRLIGGAGLGFGAAGLLWLYPYHTNYNYYDSSTRQNDTLPVDCVCANYQACGCDDSNNQTAVAEMLKNGSVAKIETVNGTRMVVINGTLANGSTDGSGDDGSNGSSNAASGLGGGEGAGWVLIAALVGATVWAL